MHLPFFYWGRDFTLRPSGDREVSFPASVRRVWRFCAQVSDELRGGIFGDGRRAGHSSSTKSAIKQDVPISGDGSTCNEQHNNYNGEFHVDLGWKTTYAQLTPIAMEDKVTNVPSPFAARLCRHCLPPMLRGPEAHRRSLSRMRGAEIKLTGESRRRQIPRR